VRAVGVRRIELQRLGVVDQRLLMPAHGVEQDAAIRPGAGEIGRLGDRLVVHGDGLVVGAHLVQAARQAPQLVRMARRLGERAR
jgi:hypothetical protein